MDNTPPSNETLSGSVPVGQPVTSPTSQKSSTTSTSSVMALIFGILSLTCCGFLSGIPAFFIGRSELKAIDEGRVNESNRNLAKIGMILGIVGTILSCLATLAYLALFAFGISAGIMQGNF